MKYLLILIIILNILGLVCLLLNIFEKNNFFEKDIMKDIIIYCISLPERKNHTIKFLNSIKLFDRTIYPEITLKDNLIYEKCIEDGLIDNSINKEWFNKNNGKLACTLSHINTLKLFLKTNKDICLVFEDDNEILNQDEYEKFEKQMKDIFKIFKNKKWNYINLSPCYSNCNNIRFDKQFYPLSGQCTNAYLISREGADLLINNVFPLNLKINAIDSKINEILVHNSYETHPRLLTQIRDTDGIFSSTNNNNDAVSECGGKKELHEFVLDIPIYYINMDKHVDRKQYMEKQLKNIENVIRVPGVDITKQNKYTLDLKYYTNLSNGEKGASLAHLNAIHQFLKDGKQNYALICEDDANFELIKYWKYSLEEIVHQLNVFDGNWTTCQLFHNYFEKNLPQQFKFIENTLSKDVWSATAYLISMRGALQVKEWTKNFTVLRDAENVIPKADYILYHTPDAKAYMLYPSIMLHNNNLNSTIHMSHSDMHHEVNNKIKDTYMKVYKNIIMNKYYTINNVFDQVYLINLEREPEKLKIMTNKLKKYGIKFKLFPGIDGKKIKTEKSFKLLRFGNEGAVGVKRTQINIIKDAKKNYYKKILILEDDLIFIKNFQSLFNKHYKEIEKMDSDWKLLYLGCSYKEKVKNIQTYFDKTQKSYGNFAVGVDSSVFDIILKSEKDDRPIDDIFVEDIQESTYKTLVMNPHLITADVRKPSGTDGKKDISSWFYDQNNIDKKLYIWD